MYREAISPTTVSCLQRQVPRQNFIYTRHNDVITLLHEGENACATAYIAGLQSFPDSPNILLCLYYQNHVRNFQNPRTGRGTSKVRRIVRENQGGGFGNQCTISLFFRQHEVANEIHQRNKFQIIKTALTNFYRRGGFYMNTYGSPFRQVQTSLCLGFTNLLSVTQTPSLSHKCSPHPIHISSPVPRPGRIPRTCR